MSLSALPPHEGSQSSCAARLPVYLPPALCRKLEALSEREKTPILATLCTSFAVLLHRYAAEDEVLIAGSFESRDEAPTIRIDLSGHPTFRESLRRTKKVCDSVTSEVPSAARLAFALETAEGQGLTGWVESHPEVVDVNTLARMAHNCGWLLDAALSEPDRRVSTLPLVSEEERRQFAAWNDTADSYPYDRCIHQSFEAQADRTPEATALIASAERLSFRELNRRANRLAKALSARGVGRDTLVGVCLERSLDLVVALLATLKASAAYVPLDPSYPLAHLEFMLEDSSPRVVATTRRLVARLPRNQSVIVIDDDGGELDRQSDDNPDCATTPDDAAYVIYTSGSTGRPKGVIGLHRGVVNRCAWMWRAYPFSDNEVACQRTSLNFVDSVAEIFVPLLQGIPNAIVPDDVAKDPSRLVDTLAGAGVTRLVLVPSLLRYVLDSPGVLERRLGALKICVSSGETLTAALAAQFHERLPHVTLLNLYGSTEVSADVTCFESAAPAGGPTVPVGRPIANSRVYILDHHLQPLPVGVTGELYVGGDGLARGYLNRPDLTAEKFIPDPFSRRPGERLYRTGDRARCLPDGNIELAGRVDHQVKIRGFRVELGEIEAVLAEHPAVREAAVLAPPDAAGNARVAAWVVPRDASASATDLRSFCNSRLPGHMVPSTLTIVTDLPRTPSGKVDRRALRLPE